MNLNKRLKKIADYINHGDNFIDVGCDHAFLSIYLILEKKIDKALATDVHEGPLKIAFSNIKEYGLEDIIKTKLGDGLEPVEDFVNTVIISGMGGITIASILNNKDRLKNVNKIIVSPNNEFYIVRKTLMENGYYIKEEVIVKDKNKYYPIIVCEKGIKSYDEDELYYGPILLKEKSIEFIEFYTFVRNTLLSYVNELTDEEKKEEIFMEIKKLTSIVE
jgi:Predicted SAM-dependent methyltransferase